METYTKTPWTCDRRDWCNEEHPHHWYIHGDHKEDAELDEDEGVEGITHTSVSVAIVVGNPTAGNIPELTAKRIVAAVNAVEGIPTEVLESLEWGLLAEVKPVVLGCLQATRLGLKQDPGHEEGRKILERLERLAEVLKHVRKAGT